MSVFAVDRSLRPAVFALWCGSRGERRSRNGVRPAIRASRGQCRERRLPPPTTVHRALGVGCRLGAEAVPAVDPSESFVSAARERLPGRSDLVAGRDDLLRKSTLGANMCSHGFER
jgi:hypothetical protein